VSLHHSFNKKKPYYCIDAMCSEEGVYSILSEMKEKNHDNNMLR
jgi:hypothetical protein